MKISELIRELQVVKELNGDIEVRVQTLTHYWDPEVKVKPTDNGRQFVLLNP